MKSIMNYARWPIADILLAAKASPDKVAVLKKHDNPTLREYIKLGFSNKKWGIRPVPVEIKKYTPPPFQVEESDTNLYIQLRRLYLFWAATDGGHPNLLPYKQEKLYNNLLSMLSNDEAEVLESVRLKTLTETYGITPEMVAEAFGETVTKAAVDAEVPVENPKKRGRKKKVSE